MSDSVLNAAAGAAGGIVAMTATYPLLVLSTCAAVESRESKSVYKIVANIIKREGVSGLYSGLGSSLLAIAATNGVYYYFYERSRGAILGASGGRKALTTLEAMISGFIAGSATTIITNPIWVVQTEQATHSVSLPQDTRREAAPSTISTIRRILAKDGLRALWRGVGPALVLVINPILQYTVFEQLKNFLIATRTRRLRAGGARSAVAVLSDYDYFLLGAISKLIATGSTYPYIVVKSRLQAGHPRSQQYKSSLHGLLTIIQEEGISGLYKGIETKLVQSVLTAAILFAAQRRIYEITKQVVSPVLKSK